MQHVKGSRVLDMHEQSILQRARAEVSRALDRERERVSQERPVNMVLCHPNFSTQTSEDPVLYQ